MPFDHRLLRPRASLAPAVLHPEADAWRTAVAAAGGTAPSQTTMNAVSAFCEAIDAAGIRDRFYRLNLFCGDFKAALAPLFRGPSPTGTQFGNATDTNVNFVSGDYVETGSSGGITGGTNKTLQTGLDPFASGIAHTDTHIAIYVMAAPSSYAFAAGRETSSQPVRGWTINPQSMLSSGNANYRSGGVTNSGIENASFTDRTGLIMGVRSSATNAAIYRKGQAVATNSSLTDANSFSAGAPGSVTVFSSAFGFWFSGRLAGYSFGLSMTQSQSTAYHTAMQAFQTALGRQV